MPELSIIIVNYKTPELILRCLDSIDQNNGLDIEIIVVDNNSQDDSVELIKKVHPDVKLIENPINEGFGRANNLGVGQASSEFVLLLNSDMIVEPGSLEKGLFILKHDPSIGVLGCKLVNEDGSNQNSRYFHAGDCKGVLKDNLVYDKLFYKKPSELKAIMGAFMLMPKRVFKQVGGFDPDFFMYAEEIELCHRIRKAGYRIVYTEEIKAIHKHGGSSEGSRWSRQQNLLSNALLYLKIRGLAGYFVYHFLFQLTTITNLVFMWKLDQQYRKDFIGFQRDYFSNFFYYLKIPFLYSKQRGSGTKFLKRS